jgi:hypothetical protein
MAEPEEVADFPPVVSGAVLYLLCGHFWYFGFADEVAAAYWRLAWRMSQRDLTRPLSPADTQVNNFFISPTLFSG